MVATTRIRLPLTFLLRTFLGAVLALLVTGKIRTAAAQDSDRPPVFRAVESEKQQLSAVPQESGKATEVGDALPDDGETPAQKKAAQEILAKLAELNGQLQSRQTAQSANERIIAELNSRFRREYGENHSKLAELRDAEEQTDEFRKLVNRQKILAMYLVELDVRRRPANSQDQTLHKLLQKARQLRQLPAAKNPAIQRRISEFEQNINALFQDRTSHRTRKKTIREIARSIVGDQEAYGSESIPYAHPTAVAGVLQEYRQPLRRLLRIKWSGTQLAVDRDHWDEPFSGKSESTIEEEVTTLLASRGYEKLVADRRHVVAFRGPNQAGRSNAQRLFQDFLDTNVGSQVFGPDKMRAESTTIGISLQAGSPFRFEISEKIGLQNVLKVWQSGNALSIQYLGQIVLDFRQAENGNVRIRELDRDETFQLSAENFAQLYRDNPEYCELRFFPLLDHLGIVAPTSRFDVAVLRFVAQMANNAKNSGQLDFEELLVALGDRSYATRESAMDEFRQDIDYYAARLRDALDRRELSTESRMRVQSLVRHASRKGRSVENEAALVVQTHHLLDDLEYLKVAQMRCHESGRNAIATRIEQLEQQTLPPKEQ